MSVPERVPENVALQRLSRTAFAVGIYCTKSTSSLPSLVCVLIQHSSKLGSVARHPIRWASLGGANPLGLKIRSQSYPNELAFSSTSTLIATVEREGHLSGKLDSLSTWKVPHWKSVNPRAFLGTNPSPEIQPDSNERIGLSSTAENKQIAEARSP